jgi:hypothetical protein
MDDLINNVYIYLLNNYDDNIDGKKGELNELFEINDSNKLDFKSYLMRLSKYLKCSDSCFILACIYIDKLKFLNKIIINDTIIHKLYFICVYLSIKWIDDIYYTDGYYSEISGLSIRYLSSTIYRVMVELDFNLYIDKNEYEKYNKIIGNIQIKIL